MKRANLRIIVAACCVILTVFSGACAEIASKEYVDRIIGAISDMDTKIKAFNGGTTTVGGIGPNTQVLATTYPQFTSADLIPGAVVFATLSAASNNPTTLNIGNTGAKIIHQNGSNIGPGNSLVASSTYSFTYDGTNWNARLLDTNTDTNTAAALNTSNTAAQAANASESLLSGTVNLHKVAKTGTYSDLIGAPDLNNLQHATENDFGVVKLGAGELHDGMIQEAGISGAVSGNEVIRECDPQLFPEGYNSTLFNNDPYNECWPLLHRYLPVQTDNDQMMVKVPNGILVTDRLHDLTGIVVLSPVARTGDYSSLNNAPDVPYINGSLNYSPNFYAPTSAGTNGYLLQSNGSGAPTWVSKTIPTITLNGAANTSPGFYAPTTGGTSGQVLQSNGSSAPGWVTKNSANTIAGLDASAKVPIANLPTGNTSSTVAIGNDSRFDTVPQLSAAPANPPAGRVAIWVQ